jgi:hypothetical protein
MSTITIPSFDFSAFYYAEILESLITYKRIYAPELTDESEYEPIIQMLRAYALVGHLNNTLLDLVANENTLPTSKLTETIRNMLRLIDYELSPASPAQSDVIYELSKTVSVSTEIIPALAQAATKREENTDPVVYEALSALTTTRTDQMSYLLGNSGSTYEDKTTNMNTVGSSFWKPWYGTIALQNAIYFGHNNIMWDRIDFTINQTSKGTCKALSNSNQASLSGLTLTVDGISSWVDGDEVFLTNQTTGAENGPWVVHSGAWTRPNDFSAGSSASNTSFTIEQGTTYAGQKWLCTTASGSDVVDTNSLTFEFIGNISGVWEYYDYDWRKIAPTSVTNQTTFLRFDLTSFVGASQIGPRKIKVQLNSTGASYEGLCYWDGVKNVLDTDTQPTLLGQSSPSTDADDYTIGAHWNQPDDLVDGTNNLDVSGTVTFTLPQTLTKNWVKATINSVEAYWFRYRIDVIGSTPNFGEFDNFKISEGKQYAHRTVTQGQTFEDTPLGSSSGLPNQSFIASKEHFIWNSEVITANSVTWTRVDNFLNSTSTQKHYRVILGENDRPEFLFPDGDSGKIPDAGLNNISGVYRYGASDDGNVGAEKIIVDRTGLTYVNRLWNPRQAVGWSEAEGASEASREKVKIIGPNSLRVKSVALGPDDVEQLALSYVSSDGLRPFSRAKAIEEGFGPKTIKLVLVATGGGLATQAQLEEIDEYFNGNEAAGIEKKIVANQEVTSINYSQNSINITATVYGNVTRQQVINVLASLIQPEAKKEDNVTWEWLFGATIPSSRLNHEMFEIDESINKVVLTIPAGDTALQPNELPVLGTPTITIEEP